MSVGISFTLCSFFFIALLTVVFFSKKRLVSTENRIYSMIILTSLFGTMIGVPCYYFMKDYEFFGIANIITSYGYLLYLATWLTLFTSYIFIISIKNVNKRKVLTTFTIIYIIVDIITCFLPLYYMNENDMVYSYGPAANFIYIVSGIAIIVILVCLIVNIRYIKQKKFLPLVAFLVIGSIIMTIQKFNPGLLLITFGEAFITFLMYFTIENPDVKLIKELNENRILVEKTNEEKSKFLFEMTAEVRHPIDYIYNVSSSLLNEKNPEKLSKGIGVINASSRKLSYLINEVLDVTSLDVNKLKIVNNKYNFYNIIEEIRARINNTQKPDVEIRYNISDNIPRSLYGDAIKLKQVIMTLLCNSVKYTEKGFIEINVSSMIKYDVCRLIISIQDSGIGMDLAKVNELLNLDEELDEKDLKVLSKIDLNIGMVKKIIKYLGGTMIIKSEEGKGSEFTIVLDQRINLEKNIYESEKYKASISKKSRVLLVDNNTDELNILENGLKKQNISSIITMYSKDCVDKINHKEKFDLIIIKDDMPNYSALDTLNELKKIDGFNTPVIVVLGKEKEHIKHHYLEDGFKDYILRENISNELNRIIDKYL